MALGGSSAVPGGSRYSRGASVVLGGSLWFSAALDGSEVVSSVFLGCSGQFWEALFGS